MHETTISKITVWTRLDLTAPSAISWNIRLCVDDTPQYRGLLQPVSITLLSSHYLTLQQLVSTLIGKAFQLSVLAGRKELVLACLNGKVKGAREQFSRRNSSNSRAPANWSRRTERLWSMSRGSLPRTSSESSCVPFKNGLVGPDTGQMESNLRLYLHTYNTNAGFWLIAWLLIFPQYRAISSQCLALAKLALSSGNVVYLKNLEMLENILHGYEGFRKSLATFGKSSEVFEDVQKGSEVFQKCFALVALSKLFFKRGIYLGNKQGNYYQRQNLPKLTNFQDTWKN